MLKNLFHRAAVADLDKVTYVFGATGTQAWTGRKGQNVENYHLEKDRRTGQWNLQHSFGASNREMAGTTIATIPKLEDAAVILRGVIEQDLKPRYGGFFDRDRGQEYFEDDSGGIQDESLKAVERALKLQPRFS